MPEFRLLEHNNLFGSQSILTSVRGIEELSRPFVYELEIVSTSLNIKPEEVVGRPFSVRLDRGSNDPRFFHGLIRSMSAGSTVQQDTGNLTTYRNYRAEMVPWLWFLSQTARSFIFFPEKEETSVLDVILAVCDRAKQVLGLDAQIDPAGIKSLGDRKLEHCVQYRETDLNFLSRILEQYGAFYYVRHEETQHTLVFEMRKNYPPCVESDVELPATTGSQQTKDYLQSWEHQYEFVSGRWEHRDYNFTNPSNQLLGYSPKNGGVVPLPNNESYEVYDYPGEFLQSPEGSNEARMRMEEEESQFNRVAGSGTCKTFTPGHQFTLSSYPSCPSEEGNAFLLTSVSHYVAQPGPFAGTGVHEEYSNSFRCIPATQQYRPPRLTPKPVINGLQTATVVGPKGEEIYTDKYGRVRVHFPWDREGWSTRVEQGEESSCWLRVAQSMAGKKWGFMSIPRIGQEVIVEFLEGDPDRPVITGSLYNEQQMPHYNLPDEKNKSYFKSNSTLGGEGYNEWMFDDTAGDERVYMHAQKNMDFRVRNDFKSRVYGNYHSIIGWEKDGEKGGDQRELVWEDKHQTIKGNQAEHIHGSLQLMIGNGDADDGGNLDLVVEKKKTEMIEGDSDLSVLGNHKEKIDGTVSTTIGGDEHTKVNGNIAVESGSMGEIHIKSGMKLILEAGMQLSIVGPGGFIDIGPAGVTIEGVMVKVNCGGGQPAQGSGVQAESPEEPERAEPAEPDFAWNSASGMKSAPE